MLWVFKSLKNFPKLCFRVLVLLKNIVKDTYILSKTSLSYRKRVFRKFITKTIFADLSKIYVKRLIFPKIINSLQKKRSFLWRISCFLRIWSRLLKKSLMENFIFCAVIKIMKVIMGKQSISRLYKWFPFFQ